MIAGLDGTVQIKPRPTDEDKVTDTGKQAG